MKQKCRVAKIKRKTRETDIAIELNIDGSGQYDVRVGDVFLRHMLETFARYASFDLRIKAAGDMEHHLVEDVAIALGAALRQALGDGPVTRVASATVPMDEALVLAAVDLVDRPYMGVQVPDLMYEHFFRSFAMESRATIHSQVLRGKDSHHIIEATFKAIGKSLGEATRPAERLLSTKSGVRWKNGRQNRKAGGKKTRGDDSA